MDLIKADSKIKLHMSNHKKVPQFTKEGYKKLKMPENLHELLLDSRNKFLDTMKDEKIDEHRSQYNCFRYNSQGFLGKY